MELDFSADVLEKMMLKKALSDKNWLNILENVFDRRWFKNKYISVILNLVLKYYDKYNVCPSNKIIQLLTKKYISVKILSKGNNLPVTS